MTLSGCFLDSPPPPPGQREGGGQGVWGGGGEGGWGGGRLRDGGPLRSVGDAPPGSGRRPDGAGRGGAVPGPAEGKVGGWGGGACQRASTADAKMSRTGEPGPAAPVAGSLRQARMATKGESRTRLWRPPASTSALKVRSMACGMSQESRRQTKRGQGGARRCSQEMPAGMRVFCHTP